MRYEPVMFVGIIVALINFALNVANVDVEGNVVEGAAMFLVTIVGALLARRKVTPVAKLEERGLPVPDRRS